MLHILNRKLHVSAVNVILRVEQQLSQSSHPTKQRSTTATNHNRLNQCSTPRVVTHVLVSWRWA